MDATGAGGAPSGGAPSGGAPSGGISLQYGVSALRTIAE